MKRITNKEILHCFEETGDGFLITDSEGIMLYVNAAYQRLTKLYDKAVPGENIHSFIYSGDIESDPTCLVAVQKKKPVIKLHAQNSNKVFIISTSEPILNEEGEVGKVLTTVRDVTEFFSIRDDIENVRVIIEKIADQIDYIDEYGDNIIAVSEEFRKVLDLSRKVAVFDVPVMILGESGTGKEVVARFIHENSNRKKGSFLAVNCAAIPAQLLETELFGYAEGTFTGQKKGGKKGLFEAAKGGTLFLDEIGDMPMELQAKLLRVLEAKAYTPVGSHKLISTDVRILSATNQNLENKLEKNEFRQDLYYRLNVVRMILPPLRERRDDILPMSMLFLKNIQEKYNLSKKISPIAMQKLYNYDWPGNIRELKNIIELMVVTSSGKYLEFPEMLHTKIKETESEETKEDLLPLDIFLQREEKNYLKTAYEKCKTTRKMAQMLQIDHSTVIRKMKKYGLSPGKHKKNSIL